MAPLSLAILQVCVILAATRLVGVGFRLLRQPQVVGELVAGILLGPSFLGFFAPDLASSLFPQQSLGFLSTLSQLGLLIFMFLVGLDLDPLEYKHAPLRRMALITSYVSIAIPFALGVGLALTLFNVLAGPQGTPLTFALFMGTAMSITAFPVLARILRERGMLGTRLGGLAIACAAIDDVTAWCMLATVVVIVRAFQSGASLVLTVGGTITFAAFMLVVVRRWLKRLATTRERAGYVSQELLVVTLLVTLSSALVTELIGIHALFGAFLAGVIMPKDRAFIRELREKLEDLTIVLLVPLYFAFTGLRTSVVLFGSEPALWAICLLIIVIASIGKWGGASIASYWTGLAPREASILGVLMNTRGLVELVVLNVGLDIGVLSPTLFAMMVLMALATTFMTTPLLQWIDRLSPRTAPVDGISQPAMTVLPIREAALAGSVTEHRPQA
jgi:K+:H+ antiporter